MVTFYYINLGSPKFGPKLNLDLNLDPKLV